MGAMVLHFFLGSFSKPPFFCTHTYRVHCFLFVRDFIYLFLERGEGKENEGEKHQCVVGSRVCPTGDLACNPGTCPDWELNQQPFGSKALSPLSYTSPGLCTIF